MRRPLLLFALAGLALRLVFLALEPGTALAGDEHTWTTWGAEVLPSADVAFSPLRFRLIFYPPAYPYFVGAMYVSYAMAIPAYLLAVVLLHFLFPGIPDLVVLAAGVPIICLGAPLLFRYSRLIWMHVDRTLDPEER